MNRSLRWSSRQHHSHQRFRHSLQSHSWWSSWPCQRKRRRALPHLTKPNKIVSNSPLQNHYHGLLLKTSKQRSQLQMAKSDSNISYTALSSDLMLQYSILYESHSFPFTAAFKLFIHCMTQNTDGAEDPLKSHELRLFTIKTSLQKN